jgi:hypothetical protein
MDINQVVYAIHNNRAMRTATVHSTCKLNFDYWEVAENVGSDSEAAYRPN